MKVRTVLTWTLLVLAAVLAGCFGAPGNSREDKQAYIRDFTNTTLENLYKLHPETRNKIKSSAGYAVFSLIVIGIIYLCVYLFADRRREPGNMDV